MSAATPAVQGFFEQYASSRTAQDIDRILIQYAEAFMSAGPKGARVTEKASVLAAFPKGQAFLRSLGHQSTEVVSLDETRMDERYALVRADFVWRFQRAPAPSIAAHVASTFILYFDQGTPRIVFQHEDEDFLQVLRASGVLPP